MTLWVVLGEHPHTQEAALALKLGTRLPGSGAGLVGGELAVPRGLRQDVEATTEQAPPLSPVDEEGANGLLVRGALRSGRVVSCQGHVTVIGDVNPGAEIIAGGDIVVWGKLRGLVHAGAYGDQHAVVCALELTPTQLRIAEHISVSPAGPRDAEPVPEVAGVKEGQIVAESWSPGYRGRR